MGKTTVRVIQQFMRNGKDRSSLTEGFALYKYKKGDQK